MQIIWTDEALERLRDIEYYLAVDQQSPAAARAMINRLINRLPQIQEMPLSGRQVLDYNDLSIREQLENPYRIIYQIGDDVIYLISILHQRQLLPKVKTMKASAQEAIKRIEAEQDSH